MAKQIAIIEQIQTISTKLKKKPICINETKETKEPHPRCIESIMKEQHVSSTTSELVCSYSKDVFLTAIPQNDSS